MKKYIISSILLLLTIGLVACGDKQEEGDAANDEENALAPPTVEITDDEKIADDEVVAVINGDEVTGAVYNLVYAQLKLQSSHTGEEVDNEEVKEATVESIIDREIVYQEAKEEGIDITEEEAETEFTTMKEENAETLQTLLDQYQITEDGFKEQLRFEITMNEYLTQEIEISISDEEVQEFYDEAKAENEEIPEFDEVKDQIKANMREEKTILALQEKVDEVKESAEIERKI